MSDPVVFNKVKKKERTVFVAVKMPVSLAAKLDRYVANNDTDRSKVLRAAVREKVRGISDSFQAAAHHHA